MMSLLPEHLDGQSVLVVGCGDGDTCIDARDRGAGEVLGVDIDKDTVRTANERLGTDTVRFIWADAEVALPDGQFDHVVVHNLLHRVRNPIALLDRLTHAARLTITLEVTGISDERPRRLLRRDYGALDELSTRLDEMPLALVGRNGTPNRKRESKFYFSPSALRHLLMDQRRHFASFACVSAPQPGRWICHVKRRRTGQLVVVSGATGTGKSTMIRRLAARDQASEFVVAAASMLPAADCRVVHGDSVPSLEVYEPQLLFHYDLLRPWRRDARVHARDEALHLLDGAERVDVVALVASHRVLRERLNQELCELEDQSGRTATRLREVREMYREPSRLIEHYCDWLAFCSSKGARISFVDSTIGYRPLAEHSWQEVVAGAR